MRAEGALLLASASPRRATLLRDAGIPFRVVAPQIAEGAPDASAPERAALAIAGRKAIVGAGRSRGELVLAADTLVVHAGGLLGKPRDRAAARRMILALSASSHRVLTGVVLLDPRTARWARAVVATRVRFREVPDAEASAYAAEAACLDKAGAYGIQEEGGRFVDEIEGPYDNVVGLPMATVRRMLHAWV